MGFLSMCGLMTAEEHSRIVADNAAQIKRAAEHMTGEPFGVTKDHAGQVANVMSMLRAARARIDQQDREIVRLKAAAKIADRIIEEKEAEIAALTPDAEATRKRRANDAKRVRPSRAKKGAAVVKAAPKVKKGTGRQ